jgi:hypothetical protein
VGREAKTSNSGVGFPLGTRDNKSVAEIWQEASSLHGQEHLRVLAVVGSSGWIEPITLTRRV